MRTPLMTAIALGVLAVPAAAHAHEEPILPMPEQTVETVVADTSTDGSGSGVLWVAGGAGVAAALGAMVWSVAKKRR